MFLGGAADFILPSLLIYLNFLMPVLPLIKCFASFLLGGFSLPGGSASAALGPAALRLSGQPCSSGAVLLVSNLNEEV